MAGCGGQMLHSQEQCTPVAMKRLCWVGPTSIAACLPLEAPINAPSS